MTEDIIKLPCETHVCRWTSQEKTSSLTSTASQARGDTNSVGHEAGCTVAQVELSDTTVLHLLQPTG